MLTAVILKPALAAPAGRPTPDAGLLAAVDVELHDLMAGTAFGDFETWYPDIYPGFAWTRQSTEVSSNGLFRIDYTVFDLHHLQQGRRPVPTDELSILLFRPASPPGSLVRGRALPRRLPDGRGTGAGHRSPEPTPSEVAVGLIEEALVSAQWYASNARYYSFFGDSRSLSLAGGLPAAFPGTDTFGGATPRRVSLSLQPGRRGLVDLVMEHAPLLVDQRQTAPFRVTLAENVTLLQLQYWDPDASDWAEQWPLTNPLPRRVRVTLGLGRPHGAGPLPRDLHSRIVALPATEVTADLQPAVPISPPGRPPSPPAPPVREPFRAANAPDAAAVSARFTLEDGDSRSRRTHAPPDRTPARDVEWEWLGRSGVELARYILGAELAGPSGQFDSLWHKWAGGPGDSNSVVAGVPMQNYLLGRGLISLRIEDLDRKFNINAADESILRQALVQVGLDATQISTVVDSILDWRDADGTPHPGGAESDYYLGLIPPYFAKNGPLDDLSELLLVQGVTPAMYFGASVRGPGPGYAVGLTDLFAPLSGRLVNLNTASASVLQLIPEIDDFVAQTIIAARTGPDTVPGTEDDSPYRSPLELARLPGLDPRLITILGRYFTVRSLIFEVQVEVLIKEESRQFTALLRRNSPHEVQILNVTWR